PAIGQTEIRISLGTKDRREAARRLPEKAVAVEARFASSTQRPITLTHQQIVALAGAWYRRELEEREVDPGDPEQYEHEFNHLELAQDTGNSRNEARTDVSKLLQREGLVVDDRTIRELETRVFDYKV